MVLQTYLQIGTAIHWDVLAFHVFASTLTSYLLHRHVALRKLPLSLHHQTAVIQWSLRHRLFLQFLFAGAVLLALITFWLLHFKVQMALLSVGVITFLYSVPLIPSQKTWLRLRDFAFSKIFIIAIIWSFTTVWIPIIHLKVGVSQSVLIALMIERFLFLLAITLPFDIRDQHFDQRESVMTIPHLIGTKSAKTLAILLLVLMCGSAFLRMDGFSFHQFLPLVISSLMTTFFIIQTHSKQSPYFYTGWIDGMMVLQFLLVLIFYYNIMDNTVAFIGIFFN